MVKAAFQSATPSKIRLVAQPILIAFWIAFLLALPSGAQSLPGQSGRPALPQPIGLPVNGGIDERPGSGEADNEKLLRALNADRQKSLVSDTNKLVRLVNELNAEIAHANPGSLSSGQLHKLAEIEKLAHNVKEKMSASVRGTPAFQAPFQPVHY